MSTTRHIMALKFLALCGLVAIAFARSSEEYGEEYGAEAKCDGKANDLLLTVCTAEAPLFSKYTVGINYLQMMTKS